MRMLFGCALAVFLSVGHVAAQSGTIVYEWTAFLDVEAPGEMASVRRLFEAGSRVPFVLHFTPSESLMVKSRSVERESGFSLPTSTFRPNNSNLNVLVEILDAWFAAEPHVLRQAYVGVDGSGVKVLNSLYGEQHRIETGVAPVDWRVTDEQREHLGYRVTVAVGEVEGESVEAWFAPDIPVSGGPAGYGGLPGMILMLSLDEGRTMYAAKEVSLDGAEDGLIRMPEVGVASTEEAYLSVVTGEVRRFRQYVRRMDSTFGNVRCTVALPLMEAPGLTMLQCMQSRGN